MTGLRSLFLLLCCLTIPARADEPKAAPTPEEYRRFIEESKGLQTYGVYLGEQKAGWFSEEQALGGHEGKEVAVSKSEGLIKMTVLGATHTIEFRGLRKYALEGDGPLVFVEDRMIEDGVETVHTAAPEGEQLRISTVSAGRTAERKTEAAKETLRRIVELDRWVSGDRQADDTFESYSTMLEEDEINSREKFTFIERKTIPWGGVPTQVNRVLLEDDHGISFLTELAADGRMLTGKMGPLDIRAEEPETAKKLDAVILDPLVNIPIDRRLGDPENVDALVLEVRGLDDFPLPESHRQTLRKDDAGKFILELARDRRAPKSAALPDKEREKYLRSTPQLQSDDQELRRLAKEIVGNESDPLKAAGKLQEWVYNNLKKSMAANSSTALQVLDRKVGDCTEHTLLFVALARAAGVPAREVGGVAYTEYDGPMFGWHAWAQIHDGSQWVTVDPTWNEVYVDATHIQLQEDAQDMQWINLLGRLELEVIDVQTEQRE